VDISTFGFRILLVFLPGLIGFYLVVDKLTEHRPYRLPQVITYSLLHGFASYGLYAVLIAVLRRIGWSTRNIVFFDALVNQNEKLDLVEIGWVTVVALIFGFLVTGAITYKIFHAAARRTLLTRRFGDQDVWDYVINSSLGDGWVIVRDFDRDLAYYGYVGAFSQPGERDEILLRQVEVYQNATWTRLYEMGAVYLPRPRAHLTMEFPPTAAPVSTEKSEGMQSC
jgi:hypothetical protein